METGAPRRVLSSFDAVMLVAGIVVGTGIFIAPSMVAGATGTPLLFMGAWLAGGALTLCGALCYAELSTAFPHAGGDYHFLTRALGRDVGFLFAWARLAVIQTGAIASLAFAFGEYATQMFGLGAFSASMYAVAAVVGLTWVNARGVAEGRDVQNLLTGAKIAGLIAVAIAGLALAEPAAAAPAARAGGAPFGLAMIFVLYAYGGWSEAAYLSAEVRSARRMTRVLVSGVLLVTVVYLLANAAYLKGLGFEGLASSDAVAASLLRAVAGETGAVCVSLLVAVSALAATNACIFTGARTGYAFGSDFAAMRRLGLWRARTGTPANALWLQGLVCVALVAHGTVTREGFRTMVEYTAPAYWLFLTLTGVSLFVLRRREPGAPRPFSVPLYPALPLVFCASSAAMTVASVRYAATLEGVGARVGILALLAGVPALVIARRMERC